MSTSVYRMAQNKCVEKKVRVERKEGIIIKTFHLWSIHFFNQLTINFNNFWKMLLPPSFNAIWWFQSSTTEVNKIHNWNLKQTWILQTRTLESRGSSQPKGSNTCLLHCRWILYQLSHQGSPRILEWVAYPFSSGFSLPKNWTRVSCIAGGFFTNWATREPMQKMYIEWKTEIVLFA